MNLKLVFEFETLDELAYFVKEQKDFNDWKTKKQFKKSVTIVDNRGAHQKQYHALAKQYQLTYPNVSYRECLKKSIKLSKEQTDIKKE